MESAENDATQNMKTLSECINKAVQKGYTENFKVTGKGLITENEENSYSPENVAISDFHRFEGYSDPQDNAILYIIQTEDGKKGMLIDSYGTYADAKIGSFIKQVEDIQKKLPDRTKSWLNFLKAS
jgi:hypothetical protein